MKANRRMILSKRLLCFRCRWGGTVFSCGAFFETPVFSRAEGGSIALIGVLRSRVIVAEEMKRRRWIESSMAGRRKSDAEKVKIALRLRRESIMTLKWIAQRLRMGSWTNVSNCLANKSK